MKRACFLAILLAALGACSSSKDATKSATDEQQEQARRKKDCEDPKWKETHLGIWYNVCRANRSL